MCRIVLGGAAHKRKSFTLKETLFNPLVKMNLLVDSFKIFHYESIRMDDK